MTIGQFMQIYNAQIGAVQAALAPRTPDDLSVRNIQIGKTAADLYPLEFPVQHALHMSLGVQRELPGNMVLGVEFVRRNFDDTLLGSLDLNRFNRFVNGVQTPVIPRCLTAADSANPNAQCSNGPITFWTPGGKERYQALLVKLDKRYSNRYLFGVSYALTSRDTVTPSRTSITISRAMDRAPRGTCSTSRPWSICPATSSSASSRRWRAARR